jgi:hypothetical protein
MAGLARQPRTQSKTGSRMLWQLPHRLALVIWSAKSGWPWWNAFTHRWNSSSPCEWNDGDVRTGHGLLGYVGLAQAKTFFHRRVIPCVL